MAEKHKSKYKKPENTKYKSRKDLKDYTEDDKKGGLNPKSAGEKQHNVLRKTDKEVVDTGDLYVKYNADDRLYKDLEDGEYDPKHAAKVLKKRQDKDEKDNAKNIKDKIENLTREQKEQFIRQYVRRKINVLIEQTDPATEEPAATEEPETETPATEVPAAETPATEPTAPTADAPAETPTPDATTPPTPEESENRTISAMAQEFGNEGGIGQIKMLNNMFNIAFKEKDAEDKASFFRMLRALAIKKISKANAEINMKEK